MPILNMNLGKNHIEIMKIVAMHKTTNLPEIGEEQQIPKKRQNNWTYLKKLVEAGFVEKAGSKKKEVGNQKKEGRRIEKYRLTETGLKEIIPKFDSFGDFFQMAFAQYEKSTKKEVENLENKLKQHEIKKYNLDRNLCFAVYFKAILQRRAFWEMEKYFDIVYRIAKSGPTADLTTAEKKLAKILADKFIIEKNPKKEFQITVAGLYWVLHNIQLVDSLRSGLPAGVIQDDVREAEKKLEKLEEERKLNQGKWFEMNKKYKKKFPSEKELMKNLKSKVFLDKETKPLLFPYPPPSGLIVGGFGDRIRASIIINYLLNPIIEKNKTLLPSIFNAWDWLRGYFDASELVHVLVTSMDSSSPSEPEESEFFIQLLDEDLKNIISDFKAFLSFQTVGVDEEIEIFREIYRKKEEIFEGEFKKEKEIERFQYGEEEVTLVNQLGHTEKKLRRKDLDSSVDLDFMDANWEEYEEKKISKLNGMPIARIVHRLQNQINRLDKEDWHEKEVGALNENIQKIITFDFIITLFDFAKNRASHDRNYKDFKNEFTNQTELIANCEFWKKELNEFNRIKDERRKKFWDSVGL